MDDSTFGLDAWIESVEGRIADTLNAKAGHVVYALSGVNPDACPLDCPHCMTDYTH